MKKIKLTQGKWAKVSDEDYEYLNQFKWSLASGYARCAFKGQKIRTMHRVIAKRMGLDLNATIDHIDRDILNNQRSNLRSATQSQQCANRRIFSSNKSGYRGVHWYKKYQKWAAQIRVNSKGITLGYFDTKEEAYAIYCKAAKHYFGEFTNV